VRGTHCGAPVKEDALTTIQQRKRGNQTTLGCLGLIVIGIIFAAVQGVRNSNPEQTAPRADVQKPAPQVKPIEGQAKWQIMKRLEDEFANRQAKPILEDGAKDHPLREVPDDKKPYFVVASMNLDSATVISHYGKPDKREREYRKDLPELTLFYTDQNLRFVFIPVEGTSRPADGNFATFDGPWRLLSVMDNNDEFLPADRAWEVVDRLCPAEKKVLIRSWRK
jgi:hypothetical protein